MLFYASAAEGVNYLASLAADAEYAGVVYAAAVERGKAEDEDDGTP